eukprot:jgi/Ulvmu1/2028/UM120_0024.1
MAGFGVVHLLKPTGGFVRVEIALPSAKTNGQSSPDHLYRWVHEQIVQENVETALAMEDPFLLATTKELNPTAVLPTDAAVSPGIEMFYIRRSLVQHSVNVKNVESHFFTPPPPSVDTGKAWSAVLYMKRFPQLWSWRRKPSVSGLDPWQPTEVVFRDKKIPNHMSFPEARWLCAPEHMAPGIRAEFGTAAGGLIEPPANIQMLSTLDYLEWAFEDLFGSWVPGTQRFCPAFPQHFPDQRDGMFDRSSLVARLLNQAYGPAEDEVINGTAVFWLGAGTPEDKRFVTLLRHSHVMPFAPLPATATGDDPTAPDTLYAVLQPIDHISTTVLADLSVAHAARAGHHEAPPQAAVNGDAAPKRAGSPGGSRLPARDGGEGAAADAQPAKRQRMQEDSAAAQHVPDQRPAGQAAPARPDQFTKSQLPFTKMLWHLVPGRHKAADTFETGFLVHVVPLVQIMQAQHARFVPQHILPALSFDNPRPAVPAGPDPRPPEDRRRSIVLGCDIDHTLINQAHAVLPRTSNTWYPDVFPPWGSSPAPTSAIAQSDALLHYMMAHKKVLHITNFSDNHKSWPDSARALKMKGKTDNEAMLILIDLIVEHVRRRKAFLVVTPDQTFKPPPANDQAFLPGSPYIDEPKAKQLHMNVILPRRDLVALMKACCPLIPGTSNCFINYKAVFTTAATQTYADLVILGLCELTRSWVQYDHDFRKELQYCQVTAFFNGPVLSMAHGRNLGPDPLLELHPNPADSGVTKNFAKFLLFGALPSGSTLHVPSWDLTKSAAIILDDSPVAWGPMERPLLLQLPIAKRFKDVEERMSIADYVYYLANFGADFQITQNGVQTDVRTPLSSAAERMRIMFEQCVRVSISRRAPLDLLLPLSMHQWQESSSMQLAHTRAMDDVLRKVKQLEESKAEQEAKIRTLEADLQKARAALSKGRL